MTGAQLAQFIGRTGGYRVSRDLNFEVRVVDARMRFGDVDLLIAPVAGNGTHWVPAYKVDLDPATMPECQEEYCCTHRANERPEKMAERCECVCHR